MTDKKRGVAVPDRIVPFPTSISEEARAALERLVGPDGMPINASYVMPSHDDVDAWMSLKATADARYAASLAERAGRPLSTVETIDVDGAVIHVAEPDSRAGVQAELHVFEAMPHGGFTGHTPEDLDLSDEVARFVRRHWGAPSPVN